MSNRGEKFTKICPQCGKEFECMKSNERKYCSRECFNKSKETGMDIKCDNCGKFFHRRQYHIDRQKKKGQIIFVLQNVKKNIYINKSLKLENVKFVKRNLRSPN